MSPLWILIVGMAVVVGGVLVLRLHAFLSLILGALIVAALTPPASVYQSALETGAVEVLSVNPAEGTVELKAGQAVGVTQGTRLLVFRREADKPPQQVAVLRVERVFGDQPRVAARALDADSTFALMPDDVVILPAAERAASAAAGKSIGERVAVGFGNTCRSIGILIAMAAIIGKCLLDSGAAQRVVVSAQRLLGEGRTPLAFLGSGFVVGIPVFFDTVFYLLMPLGKAMRLRTGKNYLLYILTIVAGATMAHSLVPPTPGPLFVAAELDVEIGLMMLGGLVVGLFTIAAGYGYAVLANRWWEIPLRESAELTRADLEAMAAVDETSLPPLWLALLPILLPVLLISGDTVLSMITASIPAEGQAAWLRGTASLVGTLGNKNIALAISAALALVMLVRQKRTTRTELAAAVQAALAGGAVIILVTAAGGAFGYVLRGTGIAAEIQALAPASQAAILPLAFAITALVRTAQGSATVAMITAVGIVAPIAAAVELPFHPLYLALAVGCGSKPISWMNDSGFWIISKMSGMTEAETLKTSSVMLVVMAIVGLAVTMAGAWLLPLT